MKKTFLSIAMIGSVLLFYTAGCSKKNEADLAAGGSGTPPVCDTVNMKYATDVLPILQQNCYPCHGNGNTGGSGGISLDGYAAVKNWADQGYLVGTITHASGFVAMPFGRAKLDDCDINKIISWVNNGKQNN